MLERLGIRDRTVPLERLVPCKGKLSCTVLRPPERVTAHAYPVLPHSSLMRIIPTSSHTLTIRQLKSLKASGRSVRQRLCPTSRLRAEGQFTLSLGHGWAKRLSEFVSDVSSFRLIVWPDKIAGAKAGERSWFAILDSGSVISLSDVAQFGR